MSIDRKREKHSPLRVPPLGGTWQATPAFRCGIGILFARLWSPLIWIFLVPLVSSHLAPEQAHNPFDTITNGQPTRQLSSTVPNTSSAGSNRKRGVAKHELELTGRRGRGAVLICTPLRRNANSVVS